MKLKLLIGFLFILSGVTSLVFESLWIRVLSLGVGSTSSSISTVLSIFFFGLAVGSYIAGRYAPRIKRPLLIYGLLEGFIGLYGVAVIYPLLHFHKILALLPLSGSLSWVGTGAKFFIVFLLLIAPTICMGATLPLLVRFFVRTDASIGRYVSFLYGLNTMGAVLGAFFAGFFFVPTLGVLVANHSVALINVAILGSVLLVHRYSPKAVTECKVEKISEAESSALFVVPKLNRLQAVVLFACFACGFSSIAAEVVWNKYLGVFFGTNIYGLGLILSLFLLGIAVGSFVISTVIDRIENKPTVFAWLLLAAILGTLAASKLLNVAPIAANVVAYYLSDAVNLLTIKSVITALILFIPTIVFGALFPLAISIIGSSAANVSGVVGVAYSINTIGSILGSYLAGIVLIPAIGSSHTLRVALLMLVATLGAMVLLASRKRNQRIIFGTASFASLFLVFFTQNLDFRNIIKSAYFQNASEGMSLGEVTRYFSKDYEDFKLIVEGKTGIISLSHDYQDGENYTQYLRLKTNGLNESIYDTKHPEVLPKYEALLGFLPYAFSRDPKSAFIVGYGGGYTVDFLTQTDLQNVHVVELEEGILDAADYVHKGMNPVLDRKNLKLEIEDARFTLATRQAGPFDIIVSQPSHSWLSGVANLFTKEFFEIVKGNLTEKGIFSQWLNLYNMDEKILKSILKTFYSVFPEGAVFTDWEDQEMIMLGSRQPLKLNFRRLERLMENPTFKRALVFVPSDTQYGLVSDFSLGRKDVVALSEDARINTDINAYAEANQSALFYSLVGDTTKPQDFLSASFKGDYTEIMTEQEASSEEFLYGLLVSLQQGNKFDKFHPIMAKYEELATKDSKNLYKAGYLAHLVQRYASARDYLVRALKERPSKEALSLLISSHIELDDYAGAIKASRRFGKWRSPESECYVAEAQFKLGESSATRRTFAKLLKNKEKYRGACGSYYDRVVGHYLASQRSYSEALPYLEEFYRAYPTDGSATLALAAAYAGAGEYKAAEEFSAAASEALKSEREHYQQLADYYRESGWLADAEVLGRRAIQVAEE